MVNIFLLAVIPYLCSAFAPPKPNFGITTPRINHHGIAPSSSTFDFAVSSSKPTTALQMAGGGNKKRRRRRKEPLPSNDAAPVQEDKSDDEVDLSAEAPAVDDGSLPDFDFDEDAPPKSESSDIMESETMASSSSYSSGDAKLSPDIDSSTGMESPRWMEAMRGGAEEAVDVSPSDLLQSRDRSLERSLTRFQDDEKEALPTRSDARLKRKGLAPPAGESSDAAAGGSTLGKKRARAEARRAAAMAAEEEEAGGENPLKSVPFFLGEDGEVSPLKVLESGAWSGIILLVLWEIYINSPFFERAGPMAPVVFQFIL